MSLHRVAATLRRAARAAADRIDALVADRPASRRMPPGAFIPNSNGEGGMVISTGQGGR